MTTIRSASLVIAGWLALVHAPLAAQVNWIANPTNSHYYALTPLMSWAQAESYAVSQGGHLATIRSAAEQAWIYQTFGTQGLWIGFSDAAVEGQWTWASGEPTTFTDWCAGEPNNASNEDFAISAGCWNDVQDAVLVPGIIERLGSVQPAQATWLEQFPASSPPARDTHGMAYNPQEQRTVLCGGFNVVSGHSSDLWEWNGTNWLFVTPPVSPLGRETFGFCYDGNGAILLFGGYSAIPGGPPNRVFDDTWRYQQGIWTALNPPNRPSARRWPAMVRTNQGVLLFGGSDRTRTIVYGDTWLWSGSNWTQLAPPLSPPARWGHWMTYDAARNVAVMFGGSPGTPQPKLADTWEFDGTTWVHRIPNHSPSPRTEATIVYSESLGKTVLFGGNNDQDVRLNETWTWDGDDWTQQATAATPSPRDSIGLAYDEARHTVVLFGGHDGTSSVGGTFCYYEGSQGSYTSFGSGCLGPNGLVPSLASVPGEIPRLGTTSRLRVTNLPQAVTIPVFVIGLSNTWDPDGYALPVDLGGLGWPGCPQLVADQGVYWTITTTGQAEQGIPVPADTPLGLAFYVQALVLYSSFPPQPGDPVAVSNGVTGIVGF